jgi:hypothetical protein
MSGSFSNNDILPHGLSCPVVDDERCIPIGNICKYLFCYTVTDLTCHVSKSDQHAVPVSLPLAVQLLLDTDTDINAKGGRSRLAYGVARLSALNRSIEGSICGLTDCVSVYR